MGKEGAEPCGSGVGVTALSRERCGIESVRLGRLQTEDVARVIKEWWMEVS